MEAELESMDPSTASNCQPTMPGATSTDQLAAQSERSTRDEACIRAATAAAAECCISCTKGAATGAISLLHIGS